jgi:predicted transcriptional regulator
MKDVTLPLWAYVLESVDRGITSTIDISRELTTSYIHTINILKVLESKNILTIYKHGRNNVVALTPKGVKMVYHFRELDKILEE